MVCREVKPFGVEYKAATEASDAMDGLAMVLGKDYDHFHTKGYVKSQ